MRKWGNSLKKKKYSHNAPFYSLFCFSVEKQLTPIQFGNEGSWCQIKWSSGFQKEKLPDPRHIKAIRITHKMKCVESGLELVESSLQHHYDAVFFEDLLCATHSAQRSS